MKKEEVKKKKTQAKNTTAKKQVTSQKETKETSKKKNTKKVVSNDEVIIKEIKKEEPKVEVEKEVEPQKEKSTKKIKVSDLILIIGLIVVAILGAFLLKGETEEITYELPLTLTGDAGLHQLTYEEYIKKVENKDAFVLIIERATCSHCVTYMPIAEGFAKDNGVPMYYVDTDTFSSDDWSGFEKSNTFLRKKSGNWGTPTTIVLVGSKAIDYIEGQTTADNLKELYNEYFKMNQE